MLTTMHRIDTRSECDPIRVPSLASQCNATPLHVSPCYEQRVVKGRREAARGTHHVAR